MKGKSESWRLDQSEREVRNIDRKTVWRAERNPENKGRKERRAKLEKLGEESVKICGIMRRRR